MKLTMPRFLFVRMVNPKHEDSRRSNALMFQVTNPTARSTSSSRSWHTHMSNQKKNEIPATHQNGLDPKHAQPLGTPIFVLPRQQQLHPALSVHQTTLIQEPTQPEQKAARQQQAGSTRPDQADSPCRESTHYEKTARQNCSSPLPLASPSGRKACMTALTAHDRDREKDLPSAHHVREVAGVLLSSSRNKDPKKSPVGSSATEPGNRPTSATPTPWPPSARSARVRLRP